MSEIEKMYENAGIKSKWRYIVHQFCHFYEADKEDILRNKHLFKERKTARIKKAEKNAEKLELLFGVFVSPEGKDSANGTVNNPLNDFSKAKTKAKNIIDSIVHFFT